MGGRSGKECKALTAPTLHEAGRARAVRELIFPQGDEGDGWNMTSLEDSQSQQRNRVAAAERTAGAAESKGDSSCDSEDGNVVYGKDAVTS